MIDPTNNDQFFTLLLLIADTPPPPLRSYPINTDVVAEWIADAAEKNPDFSKLLNHPERCKIYAHMSDDVRAFIRWWQNKKEKLHD